MSLHKILASSINLTRLNTGTLYQLNTNELTHPLFEGNLICEFRDHETDLSPLIIEQDLGWALSLFSKNTPHSPWLKNSLLPLILIFSYIFFPVVISDHISKRILTSHYDNNNFDRMIAFRQSIIWGGIWSSFFYLPLLSLLLHHFSNHDKKPLTYALLNAGVVTGSLLFIGAARSSHMLKPNYYIHNPRQVFPTQINHSFYDINKNSFPIKNPTPITSIK